MDVSQILSLLSGIALFLFGMSLMGDGLKKASGDKLEPILYKLSSTLPKAVLLGTGVTAVIQSSCATAVMVVGFVNAKMMKLRQGIGIILGAILGTSITGWVICLGYIEGAGGLASLVSTSTLTSVVAIIGILLHTFSKDAMKKNIGGIMLGFSILMFGMSSMSKAVSGLGSQPWFVKGLTSLSNPLLGIVIGALFTALLQSASAAVGIVQALSVTGAMSFSVSLPLLMGISVGAAAPVLLAALGANPEGKRTALVYPIATGCGVLVSAVIFYAANLVLSFPFMTKVMNPFSMAFVNTILRLAMVALLIPLVSVIEKLVVSLVKQSEEELTGDKPFIVPLEERFLEYPALAVEQSRITIHDMASLAEVAIEKALSLFLKYSEDIFEEVVHLEEGIDAYEDTLGSYLVRLNTHELTPQENSEISVFLHTLSDCERISDHALNLAQNAREIHDKNLSFSGAAKKEVKILKDALFQVIQLTTEAFITGNLDLARQVEPLEQVIDELTETMKLNHILRLQRGECTIEQGFVFNDMLTNCERISDHCSNIAIAMIALHDETFDTHLHLAQIRQENSKTFLNHYYKFKEMYSLESE